MATEPAAAAPRVACAFAQAMAMLPHWRSLVTSRNMTMPNLTVVAIPLLASMGISCAGTWTFVVRAVDGDYEPSEAIWLKDASVRVECPAGVSPTGPHVGGETPGEILTDSNGQAVVNGKGSGLSRACWIDVTKAGYSPHRIPVSDACIDSMEERDKELMPKAFSFCFSGALLVELQRGAQR